MGQTTQTTTQRIAIEWVPRLFPLEAAAVHASGAAADALARRLLCRDDTALAALHGISSAAGAAGSRWLAICGPTDGLPWADGAVYLGRDPDAPALLCSTVLRPTVPSALLERALRARFVDMPQPFAVLHDPPGCIGLGGARPIERALLRAWLDGAP